VICVEAEASETTTRGFAPKKPIKRVEGSGQLEIKKKWIFGSRRIIFHFLHRGGGNFALISPARASLVRREPQQSLYVLRLRRRACTKSDPERVVISLDLITRAPTGRNYRRAAGRFDFRLCHSAVARILFSARSGSQRAASYIEILFRAPANGSYMHLFHSSARGR
jgi:hypothetical protein